MKLDELRQTSVLRRLVTVGRIDFKPWSLELAVDNFAVAHADATNPTPQLAIKRLYIDMEAQSLFRLAPVGDAIQIEAPKLRHKPLGFALYNPGQGHAGRCCGGLRAQVDWLDHQIAVSE